MACGREDYWTRVAPIKTVASIEQTPWSLADTIPLGARSNAFVIEHTVDAGEKLTITGGVITCNYPGFNAFRLYLGDFYSGVIDFDQQFLITSDLVGFITLKAGEVLKVWIFNRDYIILEFKIGLMGFIEKV